MKLGTLLLRDAVISLSQLEAALRAQVLYGGRLGTNLIELGFLDVNTLGTYLSQLHNVPCAMQQQFQNADKSTIKVFGAELADLYTAFPLGYQGRGMMVALAEPGSASTVEALARHCGYPILPHAAAEVRILFYMEKHYGLMRKARYVRNATASAAHPAVPERRRIAPGGAVEVPQVVRFEPRARGKAGARPSSERPRITYLDACNAIDNALGRAQIADALLAFGAGRFDAVVVLLLRGHTAIGWRAYTEAGGVEPGQLERLTLPLGGTSVFQAASDSARPYRGPAPSAGRPAERRLWRVLSLEGEPDEMMVVPILVQQRPVNLVYAHGIGAGELNDQHVNELVELAIRASDAYARLLRGAAPD
jgi:hypothetical protein